MASFDADFHIDFSTRADGRNVFQLRVVKACETSIGFVANDDSICRSVIALVPDVFSWVVGEVLGIGDLEFTVVGLFENANCRRTH